MADLATQTIQFVVKGIDAVQKAMGAVLVSLKKVESAVAALPVSTAVATVGLDRLTKYTESWVRSGIAGTTHGYAFGTMMQLLGHQIAGLFVPEMTRAIGVVRDIVAWFQKLTGEQQRMIARTLEAAAAMVLVIGVLNRVKNAIIGVMVALDVASGGFTLLLQGFVLLGAAVAGLAVGTQSGRSALSAIFASLGPLIDAVQSLASAFMDSLAPAWDAIGGVAGDVLAQIVGVISRLATAAIPILSEIARYVTVLAERLAGALGGWFAAAIPLWERFGNIAMQVFRNFLPVIDAVLRVIGTLGSGLLNIGTIIGSAVVPVILSVIETLVRWQTALAPVANVVYRIIDSLVRLAVDILGTLVAGAIRALGPLFRMAFGPVGMFIDAITAGLESMANFLVTTLPAVIEVFVQAFGHGIQAMLADIQQLMNGIISVVSAMERLHLVSSGTAADLKTTFRGVMGTLTSVASQLRNFHVDLSPTSPSARRGGRDSPARTDVVPAGGGFEDAMALFKRINEAAVKSAYESEQREWQNAVRTDLDIIAGNTGRIRPAQRGVNPFTPVQQTAIAAAVAAGPGLGGF